MRPAFLFVVHPMVTGVEFREIALSFAGTDEAKHFDRSAFRVRRIYATLAPDERSANLRFTPDEQEFRCMMSPGAFSPLNNAWGRQGWTAVQLASVSPSELKAAIEAAWQHGCQKRPRRA